MKRGVALARRSRIARTRWANTAKRDPERAVKALVRSRSGGRCEVSLPWQVKLRSIDSVIPAGFERRCHRRADDVHHIVKKSAGGVGRGAANLIHVCRFHHDLTDAARSQMSHAADGELRYGRLCIAPRTRHCRMEYVPAKRPERSEATPDLREYLDQMGYRL